SSIRRGLFRVRFPRPEHPGTTCQFLAKILSEGPGRGPGRVSASDFFSHFGGIRSSDYLETGDAGRTARSHTSTGNPLAPVLIHSTNHQKSIQKKMERIQTSSKPTQTLTIVSSRGRRNPRIYAIFRPFPPGSGALGSARGKTGQIGTKWRKP